MNGNRFALSVGGDLLVVMVVVIVSALIGLNVETVSNAVAGLIMNVTDFN
jgi:hypothetical protein